MERYFDLYLNAGVSVPLVINANQYDKSETWLFTLYDETGIQFRPASGSIVGLKADGNTIMNAGTVNSSGQVVIQETEQITAVAGKNEYELILDGTHGTANFVVLVERRPGDNAVPSESDISLISQAVQAASGIEAVLVLQNTVASLREEVNQWVAEHAGTTNETTLWEGDLDTDTPITLSHPATQYDVIAVYTNIANSDNSAVTPEAHYFRADEFKQGSVFISCGRADVETGASTEIITETFRLITNTTGTTTTVSLDTRKQVRWNGQASSNAGITFPTMPSVVRITGIKTVQDDQEIINARVGKDGTRYNTLKARLDAETAIVDSSLTVSGAAADAKKTGDEISDLKSQLESALTYPQNPTLGTGGNMTPNNRLRFDRIIVNAGAKVVLTSSDYCIWCTVYSTATGTTVVEQSSAWETGAVTHNITSDGYLLIEGARANRNLAFNSANDMDGLVYVINPILLDKPNVITYEHLDENLQDAIDSIGEGGGGTTSDYNPLVNANVYLPELRNGSLGNGGNANSVTTKYILPILHDYDYIDFEFVGDASLAVDYAFAYGLFKGATDGMTSTEAFTDSSIEHTQVNNSAEDTTTDLHIRIKTADIAEWDHIALFMWRSTNGDYVPLRVPTDQYCFRLVYSYAEELEHAEIDEDATKRKFNAMDTLNRLTNARHTRGATNSPLTLLHFSDPHYDWEAVKRILDDGEVYGTNIDEYICTGDMVANVGGSIASWWTPKVLTCIGNHDTASYETGTGYNWTALTMAQRDQYYIAPYESNWNVVHTSGTSYYYKDYSSAKVRLIVMDSMLYTSGGSEATAQTSWLEGLLESAITNSLHVLIAIHSPHGGATAVDCSFSKYSETTMPTYSDCNTPQTVIDTVATAISGGLHFIGYIVGHTHQDNIWDAEGDGTQLMYCVTCAITKQEAQWRSSDQHRSETQDAYNLVTIDTNNSLIKLIRGGGADSDDHMRARKAICIDYSTGTVVSEAQDGNGVYF